MNDKAALKTISLQELEATKSSSVWVINNSNPKGTINMTLSDGMGNNVVVAVAVTWIPLDLTTQASKSSILASPTFRRMLSMNMIKIVAEDSANEAMSSERAQKEATRIYSHAQELSVSETSMPQEAKAAAVEGSGDVSGFAMQLAMASSMDEDQVMTTLRGNESTMSLSDFKYLAETSVFPRVKTHCAEKILAQRNPA